MERAVADAVVADLGVTFDFELFLVEVPDGDEAVGLDGAEERERLGVGLLLEVEGDVVGLVLL